MHADCHYFLKRHLHLQGKSRHTRMRPPLPPLPTKLMREGGAGLPGSGGAGATRGLPAAEEQDNLNWSGGTVLLVPVQL